MKPNTTDLEKDIVSFEQAKELHSFGWDTPTLCGYDIETGDLYTCQHYKKDGLYKPEKDLYAPTKSQVFRWFREKHNLPSYINIYWQHDWNDYSYQWSIIENHEEWTSMAHYRSYEEAENACIDKLIELDKQ